MKDIEVLNRYNLTIPQKKNQIDNNILNRNDLIISLQKNEIEYHESLTENYKKNELFLDLSILIWSACALPFLFYIINLKKNSLFGLFSLIIALIFFSIVIFLYIKALIYARDACDAGLSNNIDEIYFSYMLFDKAKKMDTWRNNCFFVAFFFVVMSTIINIIY